MEIGMETLYRKNGEVKHFLAVMSGKGGVEKSSITALLASGMQKRGLSIGILDADITGPSIPRIMGVKGQVSVEDGRMKPPLSAGGIRVMSADLLLDREDDALIWRGPMVSNARKQFWEETAWGELDYLLIDLPPGTSDAPLTVMQTFPAARCAGGHLPSVPGLPYRAQGDKHGTTRGCQGDRSGGEYGNGPLSPLRTEFQTFHGGGNGKDGRGPEIAPAG